MSRADPLASRREAFEVAAGGLKLLRLLLKKQGPRELGIDPAQARRLLNETSLGRLEDDAEARARLQEAEEELKSLAVISLFAAFEKVLRERLHESLASAAPQEPGASASETLASALRGFLEKESVWWKSEDVIELFSPPVDKERKSEVKRIKRYRDFVARRMREAAAIEPPIAHAILSDFLVQAGLLEDDGE